MEKVRRIVHHLRSKPEEERRHILNLFMFFVIAFMIILWIFSLRKTLNNPEAKLKTNRDLQPFSVLKSNLIDGFNNSGITSGEAPATQ